MAYHWYIIRFKVNVRNEFSSAKIIILLSKITSILGDFFNSDTSLLLFLNVVMLINGKGTIINIVFEESIE